MNLQRMGRLITTVTITLGILGAIIGSLLSYAIPNASQMFIDFVQDTTKAALHARDDNHAPSVIAPTGPSTVEIDVHATTAPATDGHAVTPAVTATVKPAPAIVNTGSTAGDRLTVAVAATQPGQRPDGLLLLGHGAALGGATGLIIGLPLGVLVSVIDWIVLMIVGLVDAIRFAFFKTTTVFRR